MERYDNYNEHGYKAASQVPPYEEAASPDPRTAYGASPLEAQMHGLSPRRVSPPPRQQFSTGLGTADGDPFFRLSNKKLLTKNFQTTRPDGSPLGPSRSLEWTKLEHSGNQAIREMANSIRGTFAEQRKVDVANASSIENANELLKEDMFSDSRRERAKIPNVPELKFDFKTKPIVETGVDEKMKKSLEDAVGIGLCWSSPETMCLSSRQ